MCCSSILPNTFKKAWQHFKLQKQNNIKFFGYSSKCIQVHGFSEWSAYAKLKSFCCCCARCTINTLNVKDYMYFLNHTFKLSHDRNLFYLPSSKRRRFRQLHSSVKSYCASLGLGKTCKI